MTIFFLYSFSTRRDEENESAENKNVRNSSRRCGKIQSRLLLLCCLLSSHICLTFILLCSSVCLILSDLLPNCCYLFLVNSSPSPPALHTHNFSFVYILDCIYLTFAAHALFQTKESRSLREPQPSIAVGVSGRERCTLRTADALLCL